jgi:hypothetical protein
MTIRGHIENGNIVLDEPLSVPDGTLVQVELLSRGGGPGAEDARSNGEQGQTLLESMRPIVGIVNDLPADFARNHDHYLHGQPKR